MNGWQFASSVIQAIAWPAVVIVFMILFSQPIRVLLGQVEHLKGPFSIEARFRRDVEATQGLAEAASAHLITEPPGELEQPALVRDLGELAKVSPKSAVVDAYARVEEALRQRLVRSGVTRTYQTTTPDLIRLARESGLLPPDTVEVLERLRSLRNVAAHSRDALTTQSALSYLELAGLAFAALGEPVEQPEPTLRAKGRRT